MCFYLIDFSGISLVYLEQLKELAKVPIYHHQKADVKIFCHALIVVRARIFKPISNLIYWDKINSILNLLPGMKSFIAA